MKRSLLAGLAGGAMILSLAACSSGGDSGSGDGGGEGGLVGVAMPTKSSERWIADGDNVKSQLEEAGYEVDLQYAEDDIPTQVSQLENMITKGAKALIIASIDGTTLTSVLEEAAANDIPVIAYDRLIRDSANVDYYATFDNYKVGVQQATSLLAGLGLTDLTGAPAADAPAGPFNIELFAGSPDDNNATFFFNGAMDTLKPFMDDGTLVVKSDETEFTTVATLRWDPEVAQSRMEDILTKSYSDGSQVQGVLSPYDGLSRGIISALTDAGYTVGTDFPIITGQDAELDSVKAIISGEQYATIYKDTRELAAEAVTMAQAVLEGTEPEVNDTETYDNGEKVVPSYLLEPVIVTKDDIESVLVDGGYYTDAEING
ncbi:MULTISPECIES: multiple monosaccharide ABC transporter substrate-binding protein [Rathayibacter]|jgi:putative multiple sugar transport system substrate-binding protein|uniref:Sugar ABC transporter substrate-binding protein n=1 Tax=Rathayibacter caricis DSM 15933 TaxID=1328867 RepID=A0A2T4UYB7_9MICO|nr:MULTISPECIES: multiple monosaccharide ABC transporter substrate-binding protein [Rathayibacter]KQQ21107.1 sugar ABC transporter substrate-binding protein [Rathayibacter sp. Leaf299]MCJ1696396.1 sugar-binding protein [Rathayibacter caricis]OOB91374.1 sugar ABC transporter substrate-binding protein [Rathayibacter sp. VKM Ac-2630]PTL74490.1 sugar ABC transporter substrate-binding protein [Rathayibacter caricis DSM 15933]